MQLCHSWVRPIGMALIAASLCSLSIPFNPGLFSIISRISMTGMIIVRIAVLADISSASGVEVAVESCLLDKIITFYEALSYSLSFSLFLLFPVSFSLSQSLFLSFFFIFLSISESHLPPLTISLFFSLSLLSFSFSLSFTHTCS